MKSYSVTILLLLATLALAQNYTTYGNLSFEAPPAINSSILFSFTNSSQDNKLILSPKLELLNLDAWALGNGSAMTNVTLTVYNRSAPMHYNSKYVVTMQGNWEHVESSLQDLSCNMLIETTSRLMGLLTWNRVTSTFQVAGILPLSEFTNDSAVTSAPLPAAKQLIQAAMSVGGKCRVMTYVNPSLGIMAAYRANADWSAIHVIVLPSWSLQSLSSDLSYAIANDTIYAYNQFSFTYEPKFTFQGVTPGTTYNIRNTGGRILIWSTFTTVTNLTATAGYPSYELTSAVKAFSFHDKGSTFVKIGEVGPDSQIENWYQPVSTFSVFHSPQISKIGYGISNGTHLVKIIAKHVDYGQDKWFDMEFSEPGRFFTTVQDIDGNIEFDFNDFFMVVRNASRAMNLSDPAKPVLEETYQAVSKNFTFLRQRSLTTDNATIAREIGAFIKMFVDPSVITSCLVLDIYATGNGTYELEEWDYGSLRSNRKVVKQPEPYYIYFQEPQSYFKDKTPTVSEWVYISGVSSNTNMTVIALDESQASHLTQRMYSLPGLGWEVAYQNKRCKVLRSHTNASLLDMWEINANGTYSKKDLFSSISASITNSSMWKIDPNCSRILLDGNFYASVQGQMGWPMVTLPVNFTLDKVDDNVRYMTSTSGDLWKLAAGTITKIFTPPVPFPTGATVLSHGGRIGLGLTNSTSAWFVGLEETTTGIQKCINYSNTDFIQEPILQASPHLTKIMMVGKASPPSYTNSTAPIVRTDFYFINCPTFQNISLPNTYMQDPSSIQIRVGEDVVQVLQLNNVTSVPQKEIIYYVDQNTVTLMAYEQPIVVPPNTQWLRSDVYISINNDIFLLGQYLYTDPSGNGTFVVVNVSEVNGKQAVFNNKNNGSFKATIVDGQVKVCAPGCSDCYCTACLSGFVLDTSSATCRKCAAGCTGCSASDTSACTGCKDGSFLNASNACQTCDYGCETCSGTPTACSGCPPGEFYFSSACALCPKNCFECSDASTCLTCREGFVVTSSNLCRGCSIKCAECNPYNITECTACSEGLFLNTNSQCEACSANCVECGSTTTCSICEDGYTVGSSGTCVAECQLPCIECKDNQPSLCTVCPFGSNLTGTVCVANFTCNLTESCQDCGYALNYVYTPTGSGAVCAPCPDIAHCIQCDDIDNYQCSMCNNGYFVNDTGVCEICHANCSSCWSKDICIGCTPGWTLKKGQTEGKCRACVSPCATCKNNPRYCTSCVAGFTQFGWKCRNNTGASFQLVLSVDPSIIFNDIDALTCKILQILNAFSVTNSSDCDQSQITYTDITTGSTALTGTSSSGTAANMQVGATSSNLGYTVISSSVSSYGTSSDESSESKAGLIVGLVVGIIALVVIIVVVVYCLKKKKSQSIVASEDNVMIQGQQTGIPEYSGVMSNGNPVSNEIMVEKMDD